MSVGPSPQFGLRTMTRAFGRFAHTVGYVCLAGVLLEVVGYQTLRPHSGAWLAIIPLAITILALVLLDRHQTTLFSILFLVVGGLSLFWFASILFAEVPAQVGSGAIVFSYFDVALIFVGGSGVDALSGVLWCTAAFVITQAATIGAALRSGRSAGLDPASTLIEAGLVVAIITLGTARARAQRARPGLDRAAMDEETSAMRYRIELKAAALMHDTVLGHLAAVASAKPGELGADLKREIERDLEVLVGEEWLSDVSPEIDSRVKSDWRQSALLAAIQQAREQALAVEVSGDFAAVGRLTEERDTAVGLAVKQCLVNVIRHAQVEHAEVIIIGSERDVSVMVIDVGRGFSEEHVGADRLGIRQSVRRRIEAVGGDVKVWSRPGRGTSVLIRVPASIVREESTAVPHAGQ